MIKAILFDMGGTLDGDGLHWLDRFVFLYANAGVVVPRERLRAAFDEAERRAATDDVMSRASLAGMLDRHMRWQFEVLAHNGDPLRLDDLLRRRIVGEFVDIVQRAARVNVEMLHELKARGF